MSSRSLDQHHWLWCLCVLALLLEGGLVSHATVHPRGMEQLGFPRHLPASRRREGLKVELAGGGAGDGPADEGSCGSVFAPCPAGWQNTAETAAHTQQDYGCLRPRYGVGLPRSQQNGERAANSERGLGLL
jgi:hypothetical protein